VRAQQRFHHRQVGAVDAAWHRQQAHAQPCQPGELHRPAGFVDQHRVAGLQQRADTMSSAMGGAQGRDHLFGRRPAPDVGQPARQAWRSAGLPAGSP
jgi:hypothetical protein